MQQEYFGVGAIESLAKVVAQENPKNILLVTGKKSFEFCGAKKKIEEILKGYPVVHFFDFDVNPKIEDIKRGIKLFCKVNIDLVIAVGGGSALDTAKSISLLAMQSGKPEAYIKQKNKIEQPAQTLVAIPTTSGTGSEATSFAVVYINKVKYSLAHASLLPFYVILDPSLTFCLPPNVTASTGIDALAQAIESYWSVSSTEESQQYSRQAITLIRNNLILAVKENSKKARVAMAKGANLAGKAINIAKTTACHAISYPITSYFGVPHGHAVALTLPQMLIYNSAISKDNSLDKRGSVYVKKTIQEVVGMLGCSTIKEAKQWIDNLMDEIGLERRLAQLGIQTEKDITLILENGFDPERVKNNPRMLTKDALRKMLIRLL